MSHQDGRSFSKREQGNGQTYGEADNANDSSTPHSGFEVFFCYSHKDEKLRDELESHLQGLKRRGVIAGWHDRNVSAGQEWKAVIDSHLDSAHIILLLVSSDFLNSDYSWNIEMKRAMERHHRDEARVIPIILRHCDWTDSPFAQLQVLPKDAQPVTGPAWHSTDEAFLNVVQGIRQVVKELAPNPQ